MIFGRPINLWLGFTTALVGFVSVTAVTIGADPQIVATIAGSGSGVLGAVIALVAGQPPTVNAGDTVKVTTPAGQPNATTTLDLAPTGEVTAS